MIPMRTSTVFKSRWMALIWAAGIIWFALDIAGGGKSAASASNNQASGASDPGDAAGQPPSDDEVKNAAEALGL
jgi:hypothetical protein